MPIQTPDLRATLEKDLQSIAQRIRSNPTVGNAQIGLACLFRGHWPDRRCIIECGVHPSHRDWYDRSQTTGQSIASKDLANCVRSGATAASTSLHKLLDIS